MSTQPCVAEYWLLGSRTRCARGASEDGFFVCERGCAAGIADGVSDWKRRFGVNPRHFADEAAPWVGLDGGLANFPPRHPSPEVAPAVVLCIERKDA